MAPAGSAAEGAKVIILGSGTPIPDPSASGPCVAIVVNGQSYLFDAGPGVGYVWPDKLPRRDNKISL